MEEFGSFLDGLLLVGGNSVICGDFNYWVDDPSSKPFSAEFVELLIDLSNFENFVSFPTHLSGHTLDVVDTEKYRRRLPSLSPPLRYIHQPPQTR